MRTYLLDRLALWMALMARRAWWVLGITTLLAIVALGYTIDNLKMNSDTMGLVDESEPFRVNTRQFEEIFPEYANAIITAVDAPTPYEAEQAALSFAQALRAESEIFSEVYVPGSGPFFDRNGLLYLDLDALDKTINRLAEVQPALAKLAADKSLRGLFSMIELSVDVLEDGEELPKGFSQMASTVANTMEEVAAGAPATELAIPQMIGVREDVGTRLIIIQPRVDFTVVLSGRKAVERLHAIEADLRERGIISASVDIRSTGDVVLAYDELRSIRDGVQTAGAVSLVLLLIILGFGLRSIRLIVASYVTLFIGFAWTGAWATATVGQLNMLSSACAILFIGLGIDHGIHFCLRYREASSHGAGNLEALEKTAYGVGGAIALCALSSAIGFLSFIPTAYRGFAELGIIAGGGMLMALLATYTVLPALLTVLKAARRRPHLSLGELLPVDFMSRHGGALAGGVVALSLMALFVAKDATFDTSTLALKDPTSESVTTLQDLSADDVITDYTAMVLAEDMDHALSLAEKLEVLPLVDEVITPQSYVPKDQEEKLSLIEEASDFMWPAFNPLFRAEPADVAARLEAAIALLDRFDGLDPAILETQPELIRVRMALGGMIASGKTDGDLLELEARLTDGIDDQLNRLELALSAQPVTFEDLPKSLTERDVSRDGHVRVSILPSENIHDFKRMQDFVNQITAIVPRAIGRPIAEVSVGRIVVESFWMAASIAVFLITLLLYAVLRRMSDVVLVLLPLGLAFSFSIATAVWMGMAFNFANVIVLPLLLGFGVDSGIHLVHRRHLEHSVSEVMHSSTPRAVTLSALTTVASFGSLSLSSHWGVASLGILLSLCMAYIVFCTVIVLPALMAWRDNWVNRYGGESATSSTL